MNVKELAENLGNELKDQIVGDASELIDDITEEDKKFFADIAFEMASDYAEAKLGDDDRKEIARENLEILTKSIKTRVTRRGIQIELHAKNQLVAVVTTVGKTLLKMALPVFLV